MKFNDYLQLLTESKTFKDPTYDEMKSVLTKKAKSWGLDETDIEVAIYWYASDYHSGQYSNLYSALSKSEYKPGRMETGIDDEGNESAKDLYNVLEDKFGKEETKEISEAKSDFVTSIVHLVTYIDGKKTDIYVDLPKNMPQDEADEILTNALNTLPKKATKEQVEKALTKSFKNSKILKTEPDFGYTTYKKYLSESESNEEFSESDIKILKQLKYRISSDKDRATIDILGEGRVARIIVITPADFGGVNVKVVHHINDKDSLYELEDVQLEEIKKHLPAVAEELEALVKAEEDFDNVWAKF